MLKLTTPYDYDFREEGR